ncbi:MULTISPECIES: hypothetical protein [unclassified Streptomyces]|uniref:hypothetical protein n=1 Tax=unclassified Streptomyces TaxID=2593676 RepID=UPI002252F70A|nr:MULTISPECIES: hypothetical protein [unclassified Streptomyces]MCX5146318.1 hypothetical protein [Streptomyces sp. NBC_00320]WSN49532.1 hypothetical protein OG299_18435 [Streptomyces sp. NBC_01296]
MPFEDELSEALRRTGDGFSPDAHALVTAGEQRGRRLVARRRAAVVGGSVVALALIAGGSAYTGGLFDGAGGSGTTVAAPPAVPTQSPVMNEKTGGGAVSADQLIGVFKQLLPGGTVSGAKARGTGETAHPRVSGLYDDGKGPAVLGVDLARVEPKGQSAAQSVACPDENLQDFDGCTAETLADGSKLMVFRGYEYPDRREPTKLWRATLVTPQGYQVDVQEWNATAEKGQPVSRTDPPLTPGELKAFATSPLWRPALSDLPAAAPDAGAGPADTASGAAAVLESLLPKSGITVDSKGGEGDYGYVVLDDGKGQSLVQVNVQAGMGELLKGRFGAGAVTQPDGTKVKSEELPGEKGGANVVCWTVDTLRPDGRRVVVSAFNTGNQNKPATRDKPVLTMEQLQQIALDPKWFG